MHIHLKRKMFHHLLAQEPGNTTPVLKELPYIALREGGIAYARDGRRYHGDARSKDMLSCHLPPSQSF